MMSKLKDKAKVAPGADVKTIWIGNLLPDVKDDDVHGLFYAFGEIANVKVIPSQNMAFVEYTTHESAKAAITQSAASPPIIGGRPVKVDWAKPQKQVDSSQTVAGAHASLPPPVGSAPSGPWGAYYPSMNPQMYGAYHDMQHHYQGGYPYAPYGFQTPVPQPDHMIPRAQGNAASTQKDSKKRKVDSPAIAASVAGENAPKRQKVADLPN
jgi:RNA recognition motif-containing protein